MEKTKGRVLNHPYMNFWSFANLFKAWEGINERLVTDEIEILNKGGGIYGPEMLSYNNFIRIKSLDFNEDFDFGTTLGYSIKKWSSLVQNYVDFNYLDIIKSEVRMRTKKHAKSYNYSYHFANHHGSGKDCLVSLTFTKRINNPKPVVVFNVRTSEVTKRLIFDFLLVKRICEYVYGKKQDCEVHLIAPSFYVTAEAFSMYNNHKPIRKILKPYKGKMGKFQKRVIKTYKDFMKPESQKQRYKVFLRSIMQIQKDEQGRPLSGVKPMIARDLRLLNHEQFPDEAISPKQRATLKRKTNKERKLKEKL